MRHVTRAQQYLMTGRREAVEARAEAHMRHWSIGRRLVDVTWPDVASTTPIISSVDRAPGLRRAVPFGRRADAVLTRDGLEAIADVCFATIRRALRDRSLRSAGLSPDDRPGWHLAADGMVADCLRHHGVESCDIDDAETLDRRMMASGLLPQQTDVRAGVVRVGNLSVMGEDWEIMDFERLELIVRRPIPETAAIMIRHTRPFLSQILRLPFDTRDRRVIGIRVIPVGFALEFRRRPVPIDPAPAGADLSWLRVPLMRKQDIPF